MSTENTQIRVQVLYYCHHHGRLNFIECCCLNCVLRLEPNITEKIESMVEFNTLNDPVKDPQYIGSQVCINFSSQYGPRHVKIGLLTFKDHSTSKQTGRVNMGYPILSCINMGEVVDMVWNILMQFTLIFKSIRHN